MIPQSMKGGTNGEPGGTEPPEERQSTESMGARNQ